MDVVFEDFTYRLGYFTTRMPVTDSFRRRLRPSFLCPLIVILLCDIRRAALLFFFVRWFVCYIVIVVASSTCNEELLLYIYSHQFIG